MPEVHLVDRVDVLPLCRPVTLKILIVADSSVTFNTSFGLGMMIDTLRDPVNSYVRYDVTLARRDGLAEAGPRQPLYTNFRFDQKEPNGTLTLNNYHQVWCFGFEPGNDDGPDSNISDPIHNPTTDAELAALTRWMNERQGGVFATGDHDYLGASMCSRIPRVGTMRKWTNAQGVPPISGPDRIDTNRPATPGQGDIGGGNPDVIPGGNQGDTVPQVIEWKRYHSPFLPWRCVSSPHAILCTGDYGVIDIMPDHPHEGTVFADSAVVLTNSYNFANYAGKEYPFVGKLQPKPEVIAWGNTLPDPPYNQEKGDSPAKRFPMISVYDGQRVGIGRVVVDSTWHHWMDLNLVGMAADATTNNYRRIQTYFRNIGVWLATAQQRFRMLLAASWWSFFTVEAIEEYGLFRPTWDIGRFARDVLGRHASPCQVRDWVLPLLPPKVRDLYFLDTLPGGPEPAPLSPPFEVIEAAVLGGLIKAMIPHADKAHRTRFAGKQATVDEAAMRDAATAGIRDGLKELSRYTRESMATVEVVAGMFEGIDKLDGRELADSDGHGNGQAESPATEITAATLMDT